MAPITRLAIVAMLFSAAFVNAAPALAPSSESAAGVTPELHKRGTVTIITRCKVPGTAAITFDDGPHIYTNALLDILKKKGVKATFFMNGNNYGNIANYATLVKRAHKDGHQLASHTYSHKDLATLSKSAVTKEMTQLDAAFKKILGVRPTYMRPPFGSLSKQAGETITALGYKIVTWEKDTEDWKHPDLVAPSYAVYKGALTSGQRSKPGHIFLQHDINMKTALELAPRAIDLALKKGYKVVTVGTCLGDSPSKWYRA